MYSANRFFEELKIPTNYSGQSSQINSGPVLLVPGT